MSSSLDTLDVPRARRNGVLQMINGGLCLFFNVAIFVFIAASGDERLNYYQMSAGGIWGGVFYVISGAQIFVSGKLASICSAVTALVLSVCAIVVNLAHVILMTVSVLGDRSGFIRVIDDWYEYNEIFWRKPVYVTLYSISTFLAYVEMALLIWAIFILSEAFYWRRFNLKTGSAAAVDTVDATIAATSTFGESSFNHALATVAIKVNAVHQALIAGLAFVIDIAILATFNGGVNWRQFPNQCNGLAIYTAPFFVTTAYFGYSSGLTGSNKRLVTFLILSVVCVVMSLVEGGGAIAALSYTWEMGDFTASLIAMNSLIVFFAITHLLLSVWGIVIASTALHKDGTFGRCYRNCFCQDFGSCDYVKEGGTGGGCLAGSGGANVGSGGAYQPIQLVVSHQSMTTMSNGQQALVVLLPLNQNMSVKMEDEQGAAPALVGSSQEEGVAGSDQSYIS